MVKLLIVGKAIDGPSNIAYLPTSIKDLELFGANFTEVFSVTPTATSLNLTYEPWLLPKNSVNGLKNGLFLPTFSGNTLYFGSLGGSGNSNITVNYQPYLGKSDLIFAAKNHFQQTNDFPYIVRISGTEATLSVNNWLFSARYPGSFYNNLDIIWDGSTLTVSGLAPNYPTLTYTADVSDLRNLVNQDFYNGLSPIQILQDYNTLSPFSSSLTGGDDGDITPDAIQTFLDYNEIPIEVTHILFLTDITSGFISAIDYILSEVTKQPRMNFINASPSGTFSTWVDNMRTAVPYRNNMVSIFLGSTYVNLDGKQTERYAAESGAIAFVANKGFNLTNIPVKASSFTPVLTETELDLAISAGFMPLMRYIKNDISVYQGTTSLKENSFLFSSKVAEISGIARGYCYQYLGINLSNGRQTAIEKELATLLNAVEFVTIESVIITVERDTMFVTISGTLPDEILEISFYIKNQ